MARFAKLGGGRFDLDRLVYWVPTYMNGNAVAVVFMLEGMHAPHKLEGEHAATAIKAFESVTDQELAFGIV
jgi:hypothetical protein